VKSRAAPGELRAELPAAPPTEGEDFARILRDVDELILPGITHWQSPNFFAYFPANTSGASILGDLVSAGLGVQGMLWTTSPACTELETHMLDWLVGMLGLPTKFASDGMGGGVIQDSASSAALCALIAARERATAFASNESGCDGRLVAYASTQTHSSIEKAAKIAGLGRKNLRIIEVDECFAMRPRALAASIEADRRAGLIPCFVCATVGSTSSNAIDPLGEIGAICRDNGLWLHVDAAMPGTAAISPRYRHIHDGVELAMDVYSRKIVAHEVHAEESGHHAAMLIERAVLRERIAGQPFVIHQDNDSLMKASTFVAKLQELGIDASYSRPSVSDDNAMQRACSVPVQVSAEYPGMFASRRVEHMQATMTCRLSTVHSMLRR
jgi:hypothetical protein